MLYLARLRTPNSDAKDVKVTRRWHLQVFCDRLKEVRTFHDRGVSGDAHDVVSRVGVMGGVSIPVLEGCIMQNKQNH